MLSRTTFIFIIIIILYACTTAPTPTFQLTTSSNPQEGGSVSPTQGEYEEGTSTSLTATPDEGYLFESWSGSVSGSQNPLTVTFNSDQNIIANFIKRDYPLTIEIEGEGTVTESIFQQRTTDYEYGTVVQLEANAADNWIFSHWEGDLSGNESITTINIDEEKTVTAVFERAQYELNIEIEGSGSVEEEIIQNPQRATEYPYETIIGLTANAEDGWQFSEWQGDLSGNENPIQITVDQEKDVTAVFERQVFEVSISTEGNGSVSTQLMSGNQSGSGYESESELELTATPSKGSNFIGWKGDIQSSDNSITIQINQEISLIAEFEDFPDSPFANGDGSEMYPFEIETLDQLQEIRNYTDKHFLQTNDINATNTKNWNGGDGFIPIGDQTVRFTGSFNGNNYEIVELYIDRESDNNVGLFGFIDNAEIRNVNLMDVSITGSSETGGLIGESDNGIVFSSSVSGVVRSTGVNVGGLVGRNVSGEIILSSANCNVSTTGFFRVGGLVGFNFGTIEKSYSGGRVSSNVPAVGGLVGLNWRTIEDSFSDAEVVGDEMVGGLVAINNSGTIRNSYFLGSVNGDSEVGGLVGVNEGNGRIFTSYAVGKVVGNEDVGGLIGVNGASLESSYWDIQSTSQSNGIGRGLSGETTGLNTSQMKGGGADNNMSEFDWINVWKTTNSYPVLRWQE